MAPDPAPDFAATLEVVTKSYGEMMRDGVVKLEIGLDGIVYFVHPGLLLQHSEYFKRPLDGNWKEAAEQAIALEDVECDTFEIFLEWLYTQQYPKNDCFSGETKSDRVMQIARVKACEFGDRFHAAEFLQASQNALVDSLVLGRQVPYYATFIHAFDRLQPSSPVLQALIDAHCYAWQDDSDNETNGELELLSQLPHDFLLGVALGYMRLQHGPKKRLKRCDYHGHGQDEERGNACKVICVNHIGK